MTDTPTSAVEAEGPKPGPPPAAASVPAATPPAGEPTEPDEAALGDAGKKALDAMKAERNAARQKARETEAAMAALQAKIDGKEAEHQEALKAAELEKAALAKANERIRMAEVRAAATGKLADPSDALRYLDLTEFDVSDSGEVDQAAITAALEKLIKEKPYLAAQGGRFQGTADSGARKGPGPAQLSREDLKRMSPDQIVTAKAEGRLNDLLGIK